MADAQSTQRAVPTAVLIGAERSSGSGNVISPDGLILTATNVVRNAQL